VKTWYTSSAFTHENYFYLWWGRDFPHLSRPVLRPTQPSLQWVPGLSRGQSGRGVALTTHPHLAPRLKKEYSYTLLPLWAFMDCSRVNLPCYLYPKYLTLFHPLLFIDITLERKVYVVTRRLRKFHHHNGGPPLNLLLNYSCCCDNEPILTRA